MRIEELQSIIKRTIFHPLFFNFPALDKYPMVFKSRRRAFTIMKEFEDLLYELVRKRPRKLTRKSPVEPEDELVVHLLERALEEGKISDEQFRANLKIIFLTAHENTQQLLNSTFWQLGHDQVGDSGLYLSPRYFRGLTVTRPYKISCALKFSLQESQIPPWKP